MTTGKTIALAKWTFVDKVMSLLFNMLSRLVITFLSRSKYLLRSPKYNNLQLSHCTFFKVDYLLQEYLKLLLVIKLLSSYFPLTRKERLKLTLPLFLFDNYKKIIWLLYWLIEHVLKSGYFTNINTIYMYSSNLVCVCELLSYVQLFATPWNVTHQAPLSMGFSKEEYWSGLPFPSPPLISVVI